LIGKLHMEAESLRKDTKDKAKAIKDLNK